MPRAAVATAVMPDAHNRLTVSPGTLTGNPASSSAIRAMLRLSSPAWFAQPMITSVICAGSSVGYRSSRRLIVRAAMSSGRVSASDPAKLPIAVRTPSTRYASVILHPFRKVIAARPVHGALEQTHDVAVALPNRHVEICEPAAGAELDCGGRQNVPGHDRRRIANAVLDEIGRAHV